MAEHWMILFRTIFLYLLILVIFRLMGKREIGELSILDLVVFIMIGEMAAVSIENFNDPLFHTIYPIIIIFAIQVIFSFISLKSKLFRDLVDGRPTIIINKGNIDENAMRKQRYNFDDLLVQLREKDIRNISDVEFAILEPSGKLSVFKKEKATDDEISPPPIGNLTMPLIIDGAIQEENLRRINKTELWLRQELKKKGNLEIKEISFCSCDNGKFFIDKKDRR